MLMARFCARVRKRADLPSVSMQDVYLHPTIRSLAAALAGDIPTAGPAENPTTHAERQFAEVLAGIVGTERVSVDDNFFDDLGADSMLMARFCARVRKRADLPSVSMQDVYQHPTIRSLATALAGDIPTAGPADNSTHPTAASEVRGGAGRHRRHRAGVASTATSSTTSAPTRCSWPASAHGYANAPTCRRCRCRTSTSTRRSAASQRPSPTPEPTAMPAPASQPAAPAALVEPPRRAARVSTSSAGRCSSWSSSATPPSPWPSLDEGLRVGPASPDLVRRLPAVGRVRRAAVPRPVHPSDPAQVGAHRPVEASGDPGLEHGVPPLLARQDPDPARARWPCSSVHRSTRSTSGHWARRSGAARSSCPRCPCAPTWSASATGAVIRKDSVLTGYRAARRRHPDGPGQRRQGRARRRERRCSDIGTSLGDGAQLGHSSSLHAGQTVPDGERWHGSPAQPTDVELAAVPRRRTLGSWRRAVFATVQLVNMLGLGAPLGLVIAVLALTKIPPLATLLDAGPAAFTSWTFYLDTLVISVVLVLRRRARRPRVRGDRSTPAEPLHRRRTRSTPCTGSTTGSTARSPAPPTASSTCVCSVTPPTSSTTCGGWATTSTTCGRPVRTSARRSSTTTRFLSAVGSGTMVADGLSIINADFSQHVLPSVAACRSEPRASSATGSPIPAQGRTGDNCLLATKAHGSARRTRAGRRGPAGRAQLRDPADGQARHAARREGRGRAAPQPAWPRTSTTRSPWRCCC